jgi:hypothetical protein
MGREVIALILQSRIARWIGAAVMGALAVLSFGAIKRREGVQAERAKEAERDAADFAETIREVTNETASSEPADAIRQRMRDRAGRKP